MGSDKTMIAIGIGCRKDCPAEDIESLIAEALQRIAVTHSNVKLYSILAKQAEPGLLSAAERINFPLLFLEREVLAKMNDRVLTRSAKSLELYGVASISEASALAGAGLDAVLLLPRINNRTASCAIAGAVSSEATGSPSTGHKE
jgi:cobalt-precorrin 5A hydrolase